MRSSYTLLLGVLGLSGCSQALDFRPTMASDPPFTGAEGFVLQAEMMKAFRAVDDDDGALGELCKGLLPSFQEAGSKQLRKFGAKKGPYDSDNCYVYKDADDSSYDPISYLNSGMALTDYYCDIFFDRIAERTAMRQFSRGTVNDVGAAVSAVLGLASAGSAVTGGIGAGFGILDSGIQNYDQAFTVDADLPALQKLVRSEQEKIRSNIFDESDDNGAEPETYQQAAIQIMRYANTCSFTGMRGLLTQSMIEKANAAQNPLDGSRIWDFSTLTTEQQEAVLEMLGAQKKLLDANSDAADAQPAAPEPRATESPAPPNS